MKKKIAWFPTIVLMIIIFYFSNQPADVSSDLSGGISYQIVEFTVSMIDEAYNNKEILSLAERIDYPVRKLAHLTEYALLGMAITFGILYGSNVEKLNQKRQYVFVQGIGSFYAMTDEIHQLFVPGRAGRMSDVLIDSIGIMFGFGIFIYFFNRIKKLPCFNCIEH